MNTAIYFFKDRKSEKLDFSKFIEYLNSVMQSEIVKSNDQIVEIKLDDECYDFSYNFSITRRSRVMNISQLDLSYINTNLIIEFPVLLPEIIRRNILQFVNQICEVFELKIYYDGINNIESFDMFKLITYYQGIEANILKNETLTDKYYIESGKLDKICTYQKMLFQLSDLSQKETKPLKYMVYLDNDTSDIYFSVEWKVGTQALFPELLDYINVIDKDGSVAVIPASMFYKINKKYFEEISNNTNVNFRKLTLKGANKTLSSFKKMKKSEVSITNLKKIKLINLIGK